MKQVIQSLRTGETEVLEVPWPRVRAGHVLVRTRVSLISAGTERMLKQFGQAGWIGKARQQPEKVRQVLDKVKTDGVLAALGAAWSKMDEPLALGYCNVGTVIDVGSGGSELSAGDRVVSNGPHAEVVCVPRNLCAKIPDAVTDEAAAVTVLGAVALEGIRLAEPTLGECFVVAGLGLIGLMAVQLLRAHGCRVLGIDFDRPRRKLAEAFGAETVDLSGEGDPVAAAIGFSRTCGVDGVLITASTRSNEPIRQAARMCRKRGRIVLVGVAGMELSRHEFYKKELSFRVSCSYGPGRYDPQYEQRGHDYPLPYVRWTEQRNFEAVLDMLAEGKVRAEPLLTHRFAIDQAPAAYEAVCSDPTSLGVLLEYPKQTEGDTRTLRRPTVRLSAAPAHRRRPGSRAIVGFVGAGAFARGVLMPAFRRARAVLQVVASQNGLSAAHAARRFGFAEATSAAQRVIDHPQVNTVIVATRHDSHAELVCRSLEAGKHVFVEKPLALNHNELRRIIETYQSVCRSAGGPVLMVGFNRRFAAHTRRIASLLASIDEPKALVMTVNAGFIASGHWTQDPEIGGGRIVGEACHFIDLLRCLCGHPIVSVQATMMGAGPDRSRPRDRISFNLRFADGSIGSIHYLANGHRTFPKERLDIFCAGRVLQLDNFRKLRGFGWKRFRKMKLCRQDKGHAAEVTAFLQAVQNGGPGPIPLDELVEVTRVSFDVVAAAESGKTIHYPEPVPLMVAQSGQGTQELKRTA